MKRCNVHVKNVAAKACSLGIAAVLSCTLLAVPAWADDGIEELSDVTILDSSSTTIADTDEGATVDGRDPMLISSLDPSKDIMSEDEWLANWQNYCRERDANDHAYYFALNHWSSVAYTNPEWKDNDSYCYIYNRDKSDSLTNYGIVVMGNRGVYHEYPTDDWYNDSMGQYSILRNNGQFFITNSVNENKRNWAKLMGKAIGFTGYALGVWSADSVGNYPVLEIQPW